MKQIFLILTFFISLFVVAQSTDKQMFSPETHWSAFDHKKQVSQVAIAYYKSDSLGYEPSMVEVYSYNDAGHIVQKYIRIFGDFASETAHNYVYNKGLLDSINTIASAKNFNRQQKLLYNDNNQLTQIKATGKFADYTDKYSYDSSGKLASIQRKWTNGGSRMFTYNQDKQYVHEKEIGENGKIYEEYKIYDNNQLFASFSLHQRQVVVFYNAYHRADIEVEVNENALNYALKMRKLKTSDTNMFAKTMGELQGLPTSRTLFDIPAEVRNETGDWIRRLQFDRSYSAGEKRMVFKKIVYADGTESGDTDYDMIFAHKVKHIK